MLCLAVTGAIGLIAVNLAATTPAIAGKNASSQDKHVLATSINNPALSKAAGFPANALNVNMTTGGVMSWMATPQELQRQANFEDTYLAPARKGVAASITDGVKAASSSLFGVTGTSVTMIAGNEFQPQTETTAFGKPGYYMYCPTGEGNDEYHAQFTWPAGAMITGMTAYGYDNSAVDSPDFYLYKANLGGTDNGTGALPQAHVTVGYVGGNYAVNSSATSATVDNADNIYYVEADLSEGSCETNLYIYGVAIRWKRQISPDPATTTFLDVPVGHPFHREVEALVAAGVTGGCGSNNYCPNSNVTRGQMAAFLSRSLGLHWNGY
jgi:hypothetical protein